MRIAWSTLPVVVVIVSMTQGGALAGEMLAGRAVRLSGVFEPGNLSGVCRVGDLLVIGADEGELKNGVDTRKAQVLRPDGENYVHAHDIKLPAEGKTESDIEGIACQDRVVYVVGSHSVARKKVGKSESYQDNLKRLSDTKSESSRDALYRFTLTADGGVSDISQIMRTSLRCDLNAEKVLEKALVTPSKENGVDIEGLAVKDDLLYVVFRGPVLREGWVPILAIRKPTDDASGAPLAVSDRYFVNLGGLGIRDIASVQNGFLIIAGPVGDVPPDFRLYLWDGKDMVPGMGSPGGTVRLLGDFPNGSGKPEGLAVLAETADHYDLLVVYDDSSVRQDATVATATRLNVPKPDGSPPGVAPEQ